MATQVTLGSGVIDSASGLKLRTNGTTEAVDISTAQVATLAKDAVVNGLTVGRGAGAVATNTAVGASALAANQAGGTNNTAIGNAALDANTTGDANTAVGDDALGANTTASNNTAVGYQASYSNATAPELVAIGYQASYSATGGYSTALGYRAGYGQTSGDSNTYIGRGVASINTATGSHNSALGNFALARVTSGLYNVAVGSAALESNTTASNNTAVGYQAGYSNTTGINNVALGYQALYSNTTSSFHVAIGYQAGYAMTAGAGVFIGGGAGKASTGASNTFVGAGSAYGVGELMTTGSKNTILGGYSGNQGGLDIRTANSNIVLSDGDGNPRMYFKGADSFWYAQDFYDRTTATAANLNVSSGGAIARSTSALKYKQDVRNLEEMDISALRPVRYKSKCVGDDQTKDHIGIIADEAHDAGLTELVNYGADGEVEGFQYERLTVVLLKAMQTLKAEFDAYKEAHP